MARIKRGITSHKKHKKLLRLVKGHKGGRSKLIRQARQSLLHAGAYAYAGRKQRKRDMRRLWIIQVNAALKAEGLSYAKFISALKQKNILLDRKILAELAINDRDTFQQIVTQAAS